MAAGGVSFVGSTGEDYAIPYLNAVVLDSEDPAEINAALQFLRTHPETQRRMRMEAVATARRYAWRSIIEDILLTKLKYLALRQGAVVGPAWEPDGARAAKLTGNISPPSPKVRVRVLPESD